MKAFKSTKLIKISLVVTLLGFFSSELWAQEYDDMYFNSSDRKTVKIDKHELNSINSNSFKTNQALNETTDNVSAKNVNPEYVARYNDTSNNQDKVNENADASYNRNDYYVEDYDNNKSTSETAQVNGNSKYDRNYSTYSRSSFNNYYPRSSFYPSFGFSPYASFGYSPYYGSIWSMGLGYGSGFGFSPYMGWSAGMSWGMGSYYDPWNSYYDPWGYSAFYDPWMSPYYSMGYYNSWYRPYGYYGGSNIIVVNNNNEIGAGNVHYEPRTSRSSITDATIRNSTAPRTRTVQNSSARINSRTTSSNPNMTSGRVAQDYSKSLSEYNNVRTRSSSMRIANDRNAYNISGRERSSSSSSMNYNRPSRSNNFNSSQYNRSNSSSYSNFNRSRSSSSYSSPSRSSFDSGSRSNSGRSFERSSSSFSSGSRGSSSFSGGGTRSSGSSSIPSRSRR